jgi:CubicO group peptidase (beta-lactamase class C family)
MRFSILFISVIQILTLQLCSQDGDIVKSAGISSTIHSTNIGRVRFSAKDIDPSKLTEKDFLDSYVLTNKSDLFMNVFMANSITNYMHRLAPAITSDSIVKIGNYQFSFFIDNKLIHVSNLWPGAPMAKTQDTATTIFNALIDNQSEWWVWSQFLWNRFMYGGGDSALTESRHMLRLEIRPYIKIGDKIKVGDLIAAGDLLLDVRRKPKIDVSAIKLNKIVSYDGFAVSTDDFDRNKIKELKGNIEEGVFKRINGIVVIKNGKLLIEEYFNGDDRNSLHDTRSVGKSFASTLTGMAIRDGYLKNEEQRLKEFYNLKSYDNYSELKEQVTIKDLLTMSSIFDGDDNTDSPGNEENMYPTNNWVKFALDLPVNLSRPKDQWHYFTAGVVLLGDVLNQSIPGRLEKYADEKLFQPLHIDKHEWPYTPQKVPSTAGGLRLRALDFAKYGQLYKNGGMWQGKQLVPKEWVNKSFSKQRSIPERMEEYYGYLFWNKKYQVKGRTLETYYSTGNGGNKIFVFNNYPLVVVITASAYGRPYAHTQVDKIMEEYILPAVLK